LIVIFQAIIRHEKIMSEKGFIEPALAWLCSIVLLWLLCAPAAGADLADIKRRGVLRHLGVPYAKFVTGSGDGFDADLIKLFARHLGVEYVYVKTSWQDVFGDLTGKKTAFVCNKAEVSGKVPVRGDIIANGLTILPWRKEIIDYSLPTFPTGVWLLARADLPLKPIKSSGDTQKDVRRVKRMLRGHTVFAAEGTCLDPHLSGLHETGARFLPLNRGPHEIVPALIRNEAQTSLIDMPHALIALRKWGGKVKVIGPVSPMQEMACGFAKTSPHLRQAFNDFFVQIKKDGTYVRLVKTYYPDIFYYYPAFFEK
jgi:ABC-type amino acid transport substrate-binding protein